MAEIREYRDQDFEASRLELRQILLYDALQEIPGNSPKKSSLRPSLIKTHGAANIW